MESSVFDAKLLKEIMEKKLQEKDLRGAIHLAQTVHNLYPQLKRLFRFLGNIVVPVSIEDEEIDWYTVLGVHPTVDCKTMKQHYVELVRVITEAESYEAYKILDKAWLILSNIYERKAYDMRRRSREMQLNALIAINATPAAQMLHNLCPILALLFQVISRCRTIAASLEQWIKGVVWSIKVKLVLIPQKPLNTIFTACHNCNFSYLSLREGQNEVVDCLRCGKTSAATEVSSKQAISPYSYSQASYASQPSHTVWGDKMNIKLGVDNVSRVSGSALPLVSSATPLMQPARVNLKRTYEDGDQTSATHVKAPCIYSAESRIGVPSVAEFLGNKDAKLKEKMSIGENVYAPLPSTASWSSKMTIQPGMDNVLGMCANVDLRRVYKEGDQTYATKMKAPSSYCRELGIGLPSVSGSDGANITKLKEQMGLAENTFSTQQQPNAVWSDKINVQPGMHGVSRDYTSPLASVLPATQLIQSVSVNSKKTYVDGDLTLATKVKTSCLDSRESRIGLPHVAGSIGINNVEHDGVKMSLVEKVHGSSISVPHNHMDAESGVKQMGNTQAEKVGISGSSNLYTEENGVKIVPLGKVAGFKSACEFLRAYRSRSIECSQGFQGARSSSFALRASASHKLSTFVLVLCGVCSDLVQVLCGVCSDLVQVLCGVCSELVQVLCGVCSDLVQVLCGVCSDLVQVLWCLMYRLLVQFWQQFCRSSPSALVSKPYSLEEFILMRLEDEEHEKSYQMMRRERKQRYIHNYVDKYCSNADYGDLVMQQRLHMVHWIIEVSP